MANFQKIPHKERMRHIMYRDRQWNKDAEKHERELMQKMTEEKQAAMRQKEPVYASDKHRELMEELRKHGLI